MPLFFCVSGYLVNVERLKELNTISFLEKYIYRLIIPWLIAVVFYNILLFIKKEPLSLTYYHLWYIPTFILCMYACMCWIRSKLNINDYSLIIISVLIYLCFSLFNVNFSLFLPSYLIFLSLGIFLNHHRHLLSRKTNTILIVSLVIFFIYRIILFYSPNKILLTVSFFAFNIIFCICIMQNLNSFFSNKILSWIGKNSLSIYLWHIFPILLVRFFVDNTFLYYIIIFPVIILFLISIYYLNKNVLIRKYIFGLSNSK